MKKIMLFFTLSAIAFGSKAGINSIKISNNNKDSIIGVLFSPSDLTLLKPTVAGGLVFHLSNKIAITAEVGYVFKDVQDFNYSFNQIALNKNALNFMGRVQTRYYFKTKDLKNNWYEKNYCAAQFEIKQTNYTGSKDVATGGWIQNSSWFNNSWTPIDVVRNNYSVQMTQYVGSIVLGKEFGYHHFSFNIDGGLGIRSINVKYKNEMYSAPNPDNSNWDITWLGGKTEATYNQGKGQSKIVPNVAFDFKVVYNFGR